MSGKVLAEGSALMSGRDFAEAYKEALGELLDKFGTKTAAATPRTAFDWKLVFDYFVQMEAFAKEKPDA